MAGATVGELRRLRKVLDKPGAGVRAPRKERAYHAALLRRLHREVEVVRESAPAKARPPTPLLTPEEWDASHEALRRAESLAREIEAARLDREAEERRMALLEKEARALRRARPPHLVLVAVRHGAAAPTPPPAPAPPPPPTPASAAAEPPLVRAPPVDAAAVAAGLSLAEVDAELRQIDDELAQVAVDERALTTRGTPEVGAPHRVDEFTLYARPGRGGPGHAAYFFSAAATRDGVPVPKPPGLSVLRDPATGRPRLVAAAPRARPER